VVGGLLNRSSSKRRQTARQIAKQLIRESGSALHSAFLKERKDPRTWETQVEMVRALGLIGNHEAIDSIYEIVLENKEHDMLTIAAATAYCQLARKSQNDAGPVLRLVENGGFSVVTGAFMALGCDRMIPSREEISRILECAGHFDHVKGYGDPRYGAAVAAAGWDGVETSNFLQACLSSKDSGVREAAKSSLEKKYIKCR
jgi:HEAT repeat protein